MPTSLYGYCVHGGLCSWERRTDQIIRLQGTEHGFWAGIGRNKKEAEKACAKHACDVLAALGLLTRGVTPRRYQTALFVLYGRDTDQCFRFAAKKQAPPLLAAAAPLRQQSQLGQMAYAAPAQQLRPQATHPVTLQPRGDELFLSNPKSNLAHCWQIRGYGPPSYDAVVPYVTVMA